MDIDPNIISQIIIGVGVIASLWKMTREVSSLTTALKLYMEKTDDHEDRIRKLESD